MLELGMPDIGFLLKMIYDYGNFQCFHDSPLERQIYNPFKLKQSLCKIQQLLGQQLHHLHTIRSIIFIIRSLSYWQKLSILRQC